MLLDWYDIIINRNRFESRNSITNHEIKYERNYISWRIWHPITSTNACYEQANDAGVWQAHDLLPVVDFDDGRVMRFWSFQHLMICLIFKVVRRWFRDWM
jgi:hypothetical protein